MPEYLISGRNESGRTITDMVKTATAEDALATMAERGYTDLVLHTDEVMAALFRPSELRKWLDYRTILKISRLSAYGRLRNSILKANRLFVLAIVPLIALANVPLKILGSGVDWAVLGLIFFGGVLALNGLFVVGFFTGATFRMHRRGQAVCWARWDEVIRLATPMKGVRPFDVAVARCQALAATGRLDDALHEYATVHDGDAIPEWVYWYFRARIFGAAGEREQFIVCLEEALRRSPSNSTVVLELAMAVLRVRHDANRGHELLASARQLPISDTSQWAVAAVEGLIALYSGDFAKARQRLERSLEEMAPIRAYPIAQFNDAGLRLHLATALVRLGDREAGDRQFRQAEPMLRAHRKHELIEEYQKAIDGT